VSTACPDWADRIRQGRSLIPPPLFPEEAEAALKVFKALRIVDATGSPTFGEACAPWVFDLVASIFGAYDSETGVRHITEWFVLIPKKNSKSTIAAGIMMTALIRNWRQSAEFSILAPTVEIANNSFSPARDMCAERIDPELAMLMHTQSHVKTITHRDSVALLKVLAADSNTVGGKKGVGTLVDELWLFGRVPDAENMLREATGGLASRPEGFTIYLTTQSDDPPSGVFLQKLNYARGVRDGTIKDDRFVPVIYEFPQSMVEDGSAMLPENFGMVNPNLGYSVSDDFLRRELKKAQNDGDASMRGFLAKHLNVEIGQMLGAGRWAGANYWERSKRAGLTLESLLEQSDVVTVGIDGGGLDDLLGFAVVGRERGTGNWLVWSRAWAHPIVLERNKVEAARFQDFAARGDLVLVDNVGQDVDEVAAICEQVFASGLLDKIGVDPVGIGAVLDALDEVGIPADKVVGISQGWKLTGAIKTTERKLAEGAMLHAGSPLMAWCVGNAKVEPIGNAVKITKQAAGSAKIDPLMAIFNAVSLMALNPGGNGMGGFMSFLAEREAVT
jgi:phage terminase large subunit-like protein